MKIYNFFCQLKFLRQIDFFYRQVEQVNSSSAVKPTQPSSVKPSSVIDHPLPSSKIQGVTDQNVVKSDGDVNSSLFVNGDNNNGLNHDDNGVVIKDEVNEDDGIIPDENPNAEQQQSEEQVLEQNSDSTVVPQNQQNKATFEGATIIEPTTS